MKRVKTQDERRKSTVNHAVWFFPTLLGFPLMVVLFVAGLAAYGASEVAGLFLLSAGMGAGLWFLFGLWRLVVFVVSPGPGYEVVQEDTWDARDSGPGLIER